MPSQTDFEQAAVQFELIAARLDVAFDAPRGALLRGALVGGLLTSELHAFVAHLQQSSANQADEMRSLAAQSRQRADACADYAQQLRAYEAALDEYADALRRWGLLDLAHQTDPVMMPSPGPAPAPPTPPPPRQPWMSVW